MRRGLQAAGNGGGLHRPAFESHQPDVSYRWQIILTPLALPRGRCLHSGGGRCAIPGGEGQPVRLPWPLLP